MKTYLIIPIVFAGILLASCSHRQKEELPSAAGDSLIIITQEQFKAGNLTIGEPEKILFENVIWCKGNIVAEPSGIAMISSPVQGIVQKINFSGGQKVSRGQELFQLTGNEFIELQRDLAETASQLKRLKSEYERIRSLYEENIGTEKDLILAESEFRAADARYSALKIKIKSIGLDESRIESGAFYESFSLRSPINGFISRINASIGMYSDLQTILAEVFDPARLRLKMEVFEKDFNNLREGQPVKFSLLGDTGKYYSASLTSIGKNIDEESKTITCYAAINDSEINRLVNNAFISAEIITRTDSVTAVPEESVLRSEGSRYILEYAGKKDSIFMLKRAKILVGRLNKGYVEILNVSPGTKLITRGAYNVRID